MKSVSKLLTHPHYLQPLYKTLEDARPAYLKFCQMSSKSLPASLVSRQPIRGPSLLSSQQLQPLGPGDSSVALPREGAATPPDPWAAHPRPPGAQAGGRGTRPGARSWPPLPVGDAPVLPPGDAAKHEAGLPLTRDARDADWAGAQAPATPRARSVGPSAPHACCSAMRGQPPGPLGHQAWPRFPHAKHTCHPS